MYTFDCIPIYSKCTISTYRIPAISNDLLSAYPFVKGLIYITASATSVRLLLLIYGVVIMQT